MSSRTLLNKGKAFSHSILVLALSVLVASSALADTVDSEYQPVLDERCIVNILNGTARADKDGNFALQTPLALNIPYRARAICEQNETLYYGETRLLTGVPDGLTDIENIFFDQYHPVPVVLEISALTTNLTIDQPVVQLDVQGLLPDGTYASYTSSELGTIYGSSSPDVASVSPNGLVTAHKTGATIISVRNEGTLSSVEVDVYFPQDTDFDGMPDEYEIRNALNPLDPSDAARDRDGDGLTNLEEYLLGTSPLHADTDGDTISDADELQSGTDALLPDTDGDGLIDGEELIRGTDPLAQDTDNDGINDSIEVQFGLDPLTFNRTTALTGRVVDDQGEQQAGASVVAFNVFSAVTSLQGTFRIENVPVIDGEFVVNARIISNGEILDGESTGVLPNTSGDTIVGDITVRTIVGGVVGKVYGPRGNLINGARITATFADIADERTANTDFQGSYALNNLPSGEVSIVAQDPRTGLYGVATDILSSDSSLVLDVHLSALGTIRGVGYQQDGLVRAPEGTVITLNRTGGGYTATGQLNAFGEYQFDFVPLGEYIVESFGEGSERGRTSIVLSGTNQILNADVVFLGSGRVTGYVESADGERQSNIPVTLRSDNIFETYETVQTNSNGGFEFDDVYVGDFFLTATNFIDGVSGNKSGEIVSHGQEVSAVITTQPTGTIEGTVLSVDGVPVANATVTLRGKSISTEGDGSFLFENVTVGSHTLYTSTNAGDRSIDSVTLAEANQTVSRTIRLNGLGNVTVTVLDSGGAGVSGTRVKLYASFDSRNSLSAYTNTQGEVTFQNVLAGNFKVEVFDPIDRLGGSLNSSVLPGESVAIDLSLEPAGSIAGIVYSPDGITPSANTLVRIEEVNSASNSIETYAYTGTDGRYQFTTLPLSRAPYVIKVFDSQGVRRAKSDEIIFIAEGEQLTQDFVLMGNATLSGTVYKPGGDIAAGVSVKLTSNVEGAKKRTTVTDSTGQYQFTNVPATYFYLEATDIPNRFAVTAAGELELPGEEQVVDMTMLENQLPSDVTTVSSLYDANGFPYQIQRDGSLQDGGRSVFAGDGNIFRGAGRLDILVGDKIYPFVGTAFGSEAEGRETVVSATNNESGLHISRKAFVPEQGYFARFIESFYNPSDESITVQVRVDNHYEIVNQIRTVDGDRLTVAVPVGIVASSSGDAFYNVTSTQPDRWLVVDDDIDVDPFSQVNKPAIAHIVGGETGLVQASEGEFLSGTSGDFNRMRTIWSITVLPKQTLSLMHVTAQQVGRTSALASAQRLIQLPPELLEHLDENEREQIVNFSIPSDGQSSLDALPLPIEKLSGNVFEFDGQTPVSNAFLTVQSELPYYQRSYTFRSDSNGEFELLHLLSDDASIALFESPYNIEARHSFSQAEQSLRVTDTQNPIPVLFTSTGLVKGTVRRFDGVVASYGSVELSGSQLSLKTSISEDGQYELRGLPAGSYYLTATLPDPNGTSIAGSVDVQVTASNELVRDITLAQVGGVAGQVTTVDGLGASNVKVVLSDGKDPEEFYRQTNTDSGGFYKFLDVPLDNYVVYVRDPNVNALLRKNVTIDDDSELKTVDIELIGVGSLMVQVNYDTGGGVYNAPVYLKSSQNEDPTLKTFIGRTDAKGEKLLTNVPVGDFTVIVNNPQNDDLVTIIDGTMNQHGDVQALTLQVPKDQAPTVELQGLSEQQDYVKGETVNVLAVASDDYGIQYVEFLVGGQVVYADHYSPYQGTFPLAVATTADTATVTVRAIDIAGNTAEDSVTVPLIDDTSDPVITISNPGLNDSVVEGTNLILTAQASDDIGVRYVDFYVNGNRIATDIQEPYTASYYLEDDLADTVNQLQVMARAVDYGNNTSEASRNVPVLNDVAPTVTIQSGPTSGEEFIEGTTISLSASAQDDIRVSSVELLVEGESVQTRFNPPYSFEFTTPRISEISNPLSLSFRATDDQDQSSESEIVDVKVIVNDPPTVTITAPSIGDSIYEGEIFNISAIADDDVNLDRVEFFVKGENIGSDSDSPYSMTYQMPSGVEGDVIDIVAIATDSLGQSTSVRHDVTLRDDLLAPSVSISTPQDGSIISLGNSDVIILIDTAWRTRYGWGADIDDDGASDNLLKAEVYAAKQLLSYLNAETTRIGVVDFSSSAILVQPLTNDFGLVDQKLDEILASGSSGSTYYDRAMTSAMDELFSSRARADATPVMLFLSATSGSSLPTSEIQRAADGGVLVNTFAVSNYANRSRLEEIAEGTGGITTYLPSGSQIDEILSGTVLFGVDSLVTLVDASDDINIQDVTIEVSTQDGSISDSRIDRSAPYSLASALPSISEPLTIDIVSSARDFGDNSTSSDPVSVTLLPTSNTPNLVRLDPQYVVSNGLVSILGQFFIPDGSNTPSSQNPAETAVNRVIFGGEILTPIYSDKAKIQFTLPQGSVSGPIHVSVDGFETNVLDLYIDDDQDGLSNEQEVILGTNPNINDTDGDGISDGDEVNQYQTDPLNADTDGDGIEDWVEISNSLNPNNADDAAQDADNDGLTNAEELDLGTNLYDDDSDNDALKDGAEIIAGTDPFDRDSDNDGIYDGIEVNDLGTNPLSSDTDGDGIADQTEWDNNLDPLDASDAAEDRDGDGLTNFEEIELGTNVSQSDSDNDGLTDYDEVHVYGTNPINWDTDNEGESDGEEIANGTDPLDANSSLTVGLAFNFYGGENFRWDISNQGQIGDGTSDAYDGGMRLHINDTQFASFSRATKDGDRQVVIGPWVHEDFSISRKIYVPENELFARYLEIIENTSDLPITVTIQLKSNFGSDGSTSLISTSSGDLTLSAEDTSLITDDSGDGSGDPTLAHFWGNSESNHLANLVELSGDNLTIQYEVDIPANQSIILMHFASQNSNRAVAAQSLQNYERLPVEAIELLSVDEIQRIKNFSLDKDNDGLPDVLEETLGTDPNNVDTDGDGLHDKYEVDYGLDPLVADDITLDTDGDSLTTEEEHNLGTDPESDDTDSDGLSDSEEQTAGTDPLSADSDRDGLSDGDEINSIGTNPLLADTDEDGLSDSEEVNDYSTNPLSKDTDADGLEDKLELDYGLNPTDSDDAQADMDGDGLDNQTEISLGTPIDQADIDGDGLNDSQELTYNTDPRNHDTDGDDESDGFEIQNGTDPLDPASSTMTSFPVSFTDGSGYEWQIHRDGILRGVVTNYDRILSLKVDGLFFNSEYKARKVGSQGLLIKQYDDFESPAPSNIDTQREIFVSDEEGVIRYLDSFTNTSDVELTINVSVSSSVGESNIMQNVYTSSGDAVLAPDDHFVVLGPLNEFEGEEFDGPVLEDEPMLTDGTMLTHLWSNLGATHRPVFDGENGWVFDMQYSLIIPAESTVSLLHYTLVSNSRDQSIVQAEQYMDLPEPLLEGLTAGQISQIENFDFDTDDDGLVDPIERQIGTDINLPDTDGDGLTDYFEYRYLFDPLVAGQEGLDPDEDGLSNLQEQMLGANPLEEDTDKDGLTDFEESELGSHPAKLDSDGDGITDPDEVNVTNTNPALADTDSDGLEDGQELNVYGTDPLNTDSDGDGISDGVEVVSELDPLEGSDASDDKDGDGLTNLQEFNLGTSLVSNDTDGDGLGDFDEVNTYNTSPLVEDTDSDGLLDKFEVSYGFNPLVSGDESQDTDNDGLTNLEEQKEGTDPRNPDSDEDGVNDGEDGAPLDPTRTEHGGIFLVDSSGADQSLAPIEDALQFLNIDYASASIVSNDTIPARADLADQAMVVWVTGEAGALSVAAETRLLEYINGGGCLLLSSQDHHFVRGFTNIFDEFMGLSSVEDDTFGSNTLSVVGSGPFYGETTPTYDLTYLFDNYSDSIQLDTAQPMFQSGEYIVGSSYETESHLGVFLGFPLEMVNTTEQRADIISRVYGACQYRHDLSIEYTGEVGGNDGELPPPS